MSDASPARRRTPRRPFSPEEHDAVEALGSATFPVASPPKRFARQMREALRAGDGITEGQAVYLRRIVHTFRRQIPPRVVFALAATPAVTLEQIAKLAADASSLLLRHIAKREKAGIFGVFPSTAWHLIPIVERPLGLTDFICWAACGSLLVAGRLRPMTDEDAAARHLPLRRYWPDPAPLMLVDPQLPLEADLVDV